jgi:hypothetical protein
VLIFRSNSADLFLKPGHLRSDQRDPGREPGRELGREAASLITMLGTLRSDGVPERSPSDLNDRLPSPPAVDGLRPPSLLEVFTPATAVAGRRLGPADAALVLNDRPLTSCGACSCVGSEAERMAGGR